MIISKKLTAERLEAIKKLPLVYGKDSPRLTEEQRTRLKPRLQPPRKTCGGVAGAAAPAEGGSGEPEVRNEGGDFPPF